MVSMVVEEMEVVQAMVVLLTVLEDHLTTVLDSY